MQLSISDIKIQYKPELVIPEMIRGSQTFPVDPPIRIQETIHREFLKFHDNAFSGGRRIAVGVGSRGIPHLSEIVTVVVSEIRSRGGEPFIFPAMGSHGGATAEGQKAVLAGYGITEENVHAPIIASMDAVPYGKSDGAQLYCDAHAAAADGIFLINKIKPHTDFHGEIESGLVKMSIIGAGKHKGAAAFHNFGFTNFSSRLENAFSLFNSRFPLIGGIGVVQNAYDELACLEALPAAGLLSREKELLTFARSRMALIPFQKVDLLIIDHIGKNISGSGFDPNVFASVDDPDRAPSATLYQKLYISGLIQESNGHGTGVWCSDVISARTAESVNWGATWTNCVTLSLTKGRGIPIVVPNDREAVKLLLNCFPAEKQGSLKVLRVRSSSELQTFEVSPSLWEEIRQLPSVTRESDPAELSFDRDGFLN